MTDHTIRKLDDVPDAFDGQYPGTMRFLTEPPGNQQVAFTHRVMPPHTGGKGSYGHRHKTQEEIYYAIPWRWQFKLGDEIHEVDGGTAVRVPPEPVRSVRNDGPANAELVICSIRRDDPRADGETVEGSGPSKGRNRCQYSESEERRRHGPPRAAAHPDRSAALLLRPAQPVATRHQRPAAPVLPQGHRPRQAQR